MDTENKRVKGFPWESKWFYFENRFLYHDNLYLNKFNYLQQLKIRMVF